MSGTVDYNYLAQDTGRSIGQSAANWLDIANKRFQVQQNQATQAIGGILQQSTDPTTGQVDFQNAQRLAAKAGPVAQMGMAKFLSDSSGLQIDQINRGNAMHTVFARNLASIMDNPSDSNVNQVADYLKRQFPGQAQEVEAERQALLGMTDPNQRRSYSYQHLLSNFDAQSAMNRSPYAAAPLTSFGGYQQPYQNIPGNPWRGPTSGGVGGPVTTTAGPELTGSTVTFNADQDYVNKHPGTALGAVVRRPWGDVQTEMGQGWLLPPGATFSGGGGGGGGGGVVNSDGTRAGPNNAPRLLKVPGSGGGGGGSSATTPAPAPPPPGGSQGGYTGGGIGTVLGNPAVVRAAPAAPAPAPAPTPSTVNPGRDSMTPGPRSDITPGGPQIAATGNFAQATAAAAPPGPAVAGDVAAIQRGMAQARATPGGSTQTAGDVVLGPGLQEAKENELSADLLTQHDNQRAAYPNTVFPYTQALHNYGRGVHTYQGSDIINAARGWVSGIGRSVGIGNIAGDTEANDALHKWLSGIVSSNPVAQGSDARLSAVLSSNANTNINEQAGADVIKAGVAIQRMTNALNAGWHALSPQQQAQYGGSYLRYLQSQAPKVDVRAFATDLYSDEQKKTLNEQLQGASRQERQLFLDSLDLARRAEMIGGPSARAMP